MSAFLSWLLSWLLGQAIKLPLTSPTFWHLALDTAGYAAFGIAALVRGPTLVEIFFVGLLLAHDFGHAWEWLAKKGGAE